ncbi:hypothetical protein PVAP13_5NG352900 [Panicum virgatum]|uniref:Agenet domain-containing protein n=2 Tax=Panicum virgatum TaxID=38727 RepID=A0A8T0RRY9_PANVG|nr:hypothetical protein PVAP13_5NG352900 [Panicum virgatum]
MPPPSPPPRSRLPRPWLSLTPPGRSTREGRSHPRAPDRQRLAMVRGRPRRRGRARAELGGEAARADGEEDPVPFRLGTPVEVRSDDSGFAGSFYEATVVGYQTSGPGYVVAYSTLTRSGDGGSPLREKAAAADVRPRPPPALPRGFAVHEMVEAFHNDGWWAGVVSAFSPAVPEDETSERPWRRVYRVCFPTTRELLEFEETALRPNRVFQGERWVPAAEAENGIPLFRDGSEVEVSRSVETFGKYWSPAIILKVIGATSFLVQYKDVFHEGSWWTGAILEILDNESPKKYVVKIKSEDADMDDLECVDLLTVDHTQLRPKYNWYRGKWVRFLTEKPANRGPQLTPWKRPLSAALAACSDSVELTLSAPCNDSEEIRDEPGSYLKEINSEDVVLKKFCPDLVVCNEHDQIKHMLSSSPEKVVKQQNTLLPFESHLTVPSQSSLIGFCSLKYDPKLCLSGQVELSSSRMITMHSVSQTGQLQASLFGAFGQLRPLPQGPIFRMQSHTIDFGSIVGSAKSFTDQGKQANEKCGNLMAGSKQNTNFGSFSGTGLSRKRLFTGQGKQANDKDCYLMTGSNWNINYGSSSGTDLSTKRLMESVSPQTALLLGRRPKIMQKRKRMADKKVKEASKLAAISEEPTVPNNDDGKDLPENLDPGPVLLSEVNTVTHTDSRPRKDDKGSQGVSVFLRESSVADEIIPSGVPIGLNKFHQEDYIGLAQQGATEVSVLIEKSMLSITPAFDNPDSCEDTGDKDNMEAMVKYVGSYAVPTENVSSMGIVAPNRLLSSENPEDADHQEYTCNMPETKHAGADGLSSVISFPAFKKFAAHKQQGISQQDHSSAMIEFAAEGIQSIENSEITQLSSISMSSFTEAEQGGTSIDPKYSEHTVMSKFVPSKTQGSRMSLLQRSLDVRESIMADRTTESLAIENLPFMKTSPMWEQIEAMEVFRNVPQRPNFHNFQQHVPELREGMALGLMLSFANLAESIRRLSIHDEVALFEEKMKGLSLLEADGFDVRHLRSRLETLLHIRNVCSELQAAIKELKNRSSHNETDNRHLSAQIDLLNMTVRHLELQAYLFRCITQSAISQKMNNASEDLRLKTEAGMLERSYLSAEQQFNSAATASWAALLLSKLMSLCLLCCWDVVAHERLLKYPTV